MAAKDAIALLKYSAQKGSALTADNDDWDNKIIPSLDGFDELRASGRATPEGLANALRCIIEAVYKLGYERGQREARNPLPVFVVAEEQEPAP